jgi:anti-anti-sigma factor
MKFSIDKHDKYVVLQLDEPTFTNDNSPGLKSEFVLLNTEGYRNIILDLSAVKKCSDSQDLSALLAGDRLCKQAKGNFIVCGASKEVKTILKLSKLDQTLNLVNKLDEAVDFIFMSEIERDLLGEE